MPPIIPITYKGSLLQDDNQFATHVGNYRNITTNTTTLVKSGPGFLYSITFNGPVATGVVEIDDALTNAAPIIGTITTPANPQPSTIYYNIAFQTGLSITTSVAAQNITVTYR